PARAAHEVVVVLASCAAPVGELTVGEPQDVDLTGGREGLQRPVDGGETDRVAPRRELVVELLRGDELGDLGERLAHGKSLAGHALHAHPSRTTSAGRSGCGSRRPCRPRSTGWSVATTA